MKNYLFLMIVLVFSSCSTKLVTNEGEKSQTQNVLQDYKLKYETRTMLGKSEVVLDNNNISCKNNRTKENAERQISSDSYQEIMKLANKIDLSKLSSLKAPTSKRHVDGAAYAYFSVEHNGKTYKAPDFDHGAPPEAISDVVNQLLASSPCKKDE